MTRLEQEASAVNAFVAAARALFDAADDLARAGDMAAARSANAAAAKCAKEGMELADSVLARPWVRIFDWLWNFLGGRGVDAK